MARKTVKAPKKRGRTATRRLPPHRPKKRVDYYYRPKGRHLSQRDAELLGEALEVLEKRHGVVTPEQLYKYAKPKNSPIHHLWEWDLKKAAESHWIEHARFLLRHVEIVYEHDGEEREVNCAVSIERDGERGYLHSMTAAKSPDLREQMLQQALRDLEAWRKRYSALQELADLFEEVDRVIAAKKAA